MEAGGRRKGPLIVRVRHVGIVTGRSVIRGALFKSSLGSLGRVVNRLKGACSLGRELVDGVGLVVECNTSGVSRDTT